MTQRGEFQVPANVEAEKCVLSMIFQDQAVIAQILDKVKPEDFYSPAHKLIFTAMLNLWDKNLDLNRVSVMDEVNRLEDIKAVGGLAYLFELESYEASTAGLDYYVDSIRGKSLIRRMLETADAIVKEGLADTRETEEYLDWAEHQVFQVVQNQLKPSYQQFKEILRQLIQDVDKRRRGDAGIPAVPTGFMDLDRVLGGLHHSDLIILAARPGMGKTALALNMASHMALHEKKHVVIFSLEMSSVQLATRIISSQSKGMGAGLNGRQILDGKLTREQRDILTELLPRLGSAPIVVDDTPALSILELRARARRLKADGQCDMIIIDYLQLMRGATPTSSREQEVAEISRSLKALAKDLDIPIMALAQLNRMLESRADKRPLLSDLRESGSIEQDADVILFIYRDEVYAKEKSEKPGVAEVIIGKHRHGSTGTVELHFDPQFTLFVNLMKEESHFPG